MIYLIFYFISFIACIGGAICGIGGGVIIKPVLDAFAVLDVATISYLSGCTVLAMTCYSVGRAMWKRESVIELSTSTPLAIGAIGGGIIGKVLFEYLAAIFTSHNKVGAVQSIIIFFLTLGTMIYTIAQDKIKTYRTKNIYVCIIIGLLLGILSSFLGIGGGPINLVILYFFFSMQSKVAAQNSLYIILFSQTASLFQTIITKTVPEFSLMLFFGMVICGILGGVIGGKINKKIDNKDVNKLFIILMIIIMLITVYNTYHYIYIA
jgi:uncharacterized membrane protein YfcA